MKKSKIILSLIVSLIYAALIGSAAAITIPDVSTVTVATSFFVLRTSYLFLFEGAHITGVLLSGVNKEIWIDALKENFYAAYPWLEMVTSWDEWVENNTINFAAIGADPTILKNNTVWPIVATDRTDTPVTVTLDTYDSTTTRLNNVLEVEASYKKLESVIQQHRRSLMQRLVSEGLWNFAPATAALGAVAATGANRSAAIKTQSTVAAKLKLSDVAGIQERWDDIDAPQTGRILMLNPFHRRDLMEEDAALFKDFTNLKTGQALPLFGIDIFVASNTPLYTKGTLAKKAFGAAVDNANDCISSIAFISSEVGRAMGDMEMIFTPKESNTAYRANEVGFQTRFKTFTHRPTTSIMQQAIISNRA